MNKITDITHQVNNDDRYSVYINGKFAFGITDFDLIRHSLKIGMELSDEELENILFTTDETKCQDYANSLVCARMYTRKELLRKLTAKKFTNEIIERALEKLAEYGYVDDRAYAEMYISEMKQKFGIFKLKQKLFEKGIASEIIDECLQELNNFDVAINHLKTKFRNQPIDTGSKQKALRFLTQKGFAYDDASDAIRTYMEEINGTYDE